MALDWFEWKGEDCREYGLRAIELPPITFAEERVNFVTVPGRSGSLAMLEGDAVYEDITLNLTVLADASADLDAVAEWLRGSGTLALPNRPGGWYEARVVDQLELSRVIPARDARTFPVSFRAKPFFYLEGAASIEITESGARIRNPGNLSSAPRVTVYGSGSVLLTIGGQLVALSGLDGGIVLDSELLDALSLDGAELLNGQMSGEFFEIAPGVSTVSWTADDGATGTITRVVIEPRWRSR